METAQKRELAREEIAEIVRQIPPIDWERIWHISSMSFAERVKENMEETETVRADLYAEFAKRFPNETYSEINMRVLRAVTDVRRE